VRIFILFFYIVTIALEANQVDFLPEKLIISGSENIAIANEDLLKLKVYFIENPLTRELQEKHDLTLEVEVLEPFYMVVIKPITSLSLRSELLIVLSPMFQDIFYIEHKIEPVKIKQIDFNKALTKKSLPLNENESKKEKSLIEEIGLQWLALWCLSLIGLILSIRSRRKIARLATTQKDLKEEQEKIETEIKTLGVTND